MSDSTQHDSRDKARTSEWSQVRETVLMLELSSGQIEAAMKDSNASVDVLTTSFTAMADTMNTMSGAIAALPENSETSATKESLSMASLSVTSMVHQAIVAFQFYDKLVQRLAHVNHSLAGLSNLVADDGRIANPQEWIQLQQSIRSKYSMREEQAMFDAVMNGMPVQEAIDHFMAERKEQSDDVELF